MPSPQQALERYRAEADALDAEILRTIHTRCVPDFNALALRIFAHQLRWNAPYARYCAALGISLERMPSSWEAIPPVPAAAYKETALCTFDPAKAQLAFQTSGTTRGTGGMHYMESAALYDAALLAGFREGMLAGDPEPLRYLLLVPNPAENPRSSLGYMMRRVAEELGDGGHAWFLRAEHLAVDAFCTAVERAIAEGRPICIAATAFALVHLLDGLRERGREQFALPPGSRIMETGGFKGRARRVERHVLYADLCEWFGIIPEQIVAEYGMTELTSQYYDGPGRVKIAPPWMRARVVDPQGSTLPPEIVGSLVHVDLANRSSCVAIATEDLGAAVDGGFVLLGREVGAELRGCSLDAESLARVQS